MHANDAYKTRASSMAIRNFYSNIIMKMTFLVTEISSFVDYTRLSYLRPTVKVNKLWPVRGSVTQTAKLF